MFEGFEERQRQPGAWRAIAGIAFIASVAIAVVTHWINRPRGENLSAFAEGHARPRSSTPGPARATGLPGMSLDLPGAAAITGDYDEGGAEAPRITVSWKPGAPAAPADRPALVGELGARLKPTSITAATFDGHPGHVLVYDQGGSQIILMDTTCGDRAIEIRVENDRADADRARTSFRCTPHPGRLLTQSVAVEPRAGWHRVPSTKDLVLENDARVAIRLTARSAGVAPELNDTIQFDGAAEPHGDHDIRRGSLVPATASGSSGPVVLVTWPCAGGAIAYAYVWSEARTPLDDGLALALTGRCLGPDEPLPTYP